ncbi:Hypothetical predicted protein [Octopus vulgaris]|uniref:Uncharacterized protein n=1 Tax=Octopus vulgaris TaxID=6645 RepID=A0AA36B8E7_OCTVU|nr:Hypothetical predicted protein [Octopus vulgaris]
MTAAAEEMIGVARKKDRDWFHENDETISRLIEAKLRTCLALENHSTVENKRKHQQASSECQRGIREAQNIWWQRKAKEMQNHADQLLCRNQVLRPHKVISGRPEERS